MLAPRNRWARLRPDIADARILPHAFAAALTAVLVSGCNSRTDLDSADPRRRAAAVGRLGGDRPEQALPALLLAQGDRSVEVRLAAASAFVRLGGPSAAEGLGAMLEDVDAGVAGAAARGLADLPSEAGGKERLLAGYAQASSAGRAAIAEALGHIGGSLREAVEAEARIRYDRNLAALERGSAAERAGAAEELGASGRAEALQRLAGLLAEAEQVDPVVLAGLARGLGAGGDGAHQPRLERLLSSQRTGVAAAAADGLRLLRDPRSAPGLAAVAEAGGAQADAALEALAALPDAVEVASALCAVAGRSPDSARAAHAARLARQRGSGCPARPLLGRIGRTGERAALAALAELRWDGADAEAVSRRMLAILAVRGGEPGSRALAARVVGSAGWAGAAVEVAERASLIFKRLDEAQARSIADGKSPAGPPEPAGATELGALLASGGRLHADAAGPLILRGLDRPWPAVRSGAIEGQGWLVGSAAAAALERGLIDEAAVVRSAAARALGRCGDAGAAALARAAARSRPGEGAWRVELAQALGLTGSAEAVPGLGRLLEGESAGAAIQALSKLGGVAAGRLVRAMVERGEGARLPEAVEALASIAGAEAGPAIGRLVTSERVEVREAAVRALGRIRYEPASAGLEALKSDYFGRVRRAAIESLARLPSRRPGARR